MAKLIFYPIGNADSTLIHLDDDRILLKDFMNLSSENDDDKRINLSEELLSYLGSEERDYFDVVAFTHADADHVHGAKDFFWFDHASTYQGDDRVKIHELHVPTNFLLEPSLKDSARVIRQEARHRLKEGEGIRVYGKPEQLEEWFSREGIDPSSRSDFIISAGSLLPDFSRSKGFVEIFTHSPFSFRIEEDEEERNDNSIVWHLTFFDYSREFRCLLGADAEHQTWANIVYLTELNRNEERLKFDLFRISHHCSYTALSDEKGDDETEPRDEVQKLFSNGEVGCILISSSNPIPQSDTGQPPHRQAAAFYKKIAKKFGNEDNFVVTMEFPTEDDPRPIVVETTSNGFALKRNITITGGVANVLRKPSPRVG